jgi:single-strand DNA-binding protein
VAVDGRLDQRSWDAQDGTKRSKVEIIADTVMFIGGQTGEVREPVMRNAGPAAVASAAQDDFRDIDFGGDDIPF